MMDGNEIEFTSQHYESQKSEVMLSFVQFLLACFSCIIGLIEMLGDGVIIRELEESDNQSVIELFRRGLLSYEIQDDVSNIDREITKRMQNQFVNDKLNPINGDMFDIYKTYRTNTTRISNFWVAMDSSSGKVVGCIGAMEDNHKACELVRMSIDISQRGQGLAAKLIDRLQSWARSSGFSKVTLSTLTTMTPAIRLYRRCGFEEYMTESIPPCFFDELSESMRYDDVECSVAIVYFQKQLS